MIKRLLPLLTACLLLPACQQQVTRITDMADLPVKQEIAPDFDWKLSPLRANAQYILFHANTYKGRSMLKGDYYFLRWYDAAPEKPARVVMRYTQAATGSQVKQLVKEYKEPRDSRGTRKEQFFFNGPERQKLGDIMSWRVELYSDGKLVDSRQSYLWQ